MTRVFLYLVAQIFSMSTYAAIRTAFSTVVTSLYPSDKQVFGTTDQISQATLGENQDLFGMFTGFRLVPELRGNTDVTQDFGFYVGKLDQFDKTPESTQSLIDACEVKAKAIVEAFIDSEQSAKMSIEDFTILPYYIGMNDTTSGVWCLATLRVNQALFC